MALTELNCGSNLAGTILISGAWIMLGLRSSSGLSSALGFLYTIREFDSS